MDTGRRVSGDPADRLKPAPAELQPYFCANCGLRLAGHDCPRCGQEARIRLPTARWFLDLLAVPG